MGEIRFVGTDVIRGYPYPVCKKSWYYYNMRPVAHDSHDEICRMPLNYLICTGQSNVSAYVTGAPLLRRRHYNWALPWYFVSASTLPENNDQTS